VPIAPILQEPRCLGLGYDKLTVLGDLGTAVGVPSIAEEPQTDLACHLPDDDV
jgi:hypothetical protein